ncbi:MAG: ABC transporter ATP-binding protein [Actinomycetota bacterium]
MAEPLLEIRDATKVYGEGRVLHKGQGVAALRDFNLTIPEEPATVTTIAGESGSGKTTLANAVLGFTTLSSGAIMYRGRDVATMNKRQKLDYRREVQAIFQDPYEVYNPFYRIKHMLGQVTHRFRLADNPDDERQLMEDALQSVGLRGDEVLEKYPHQLSGGQRQRIRIARAYLLKPRLVVADEPVSMVDASLRAMILDIMMRMRDELQVSFLYITHDLSTAYQVGDSILILYSGTVAERGEAVEVIDNPKHPYVQLLVGSVPVPDPSQKWTTEVKLPSEDELREHIDRGCLYYPRCPHRMDRCLTEHPPLYGIGGDDHRAACYLYDVDTSEEKATV